MRFFDPGDKILMQQRCLPHWAQAGTMCFITWRTHDSMPKAVIESWLADRDRWLRANGIDPSDVNWRSQLEELEGRLQAEFHETLASRWHNELDACHGECVLRQPKLAKVVHDSLLHFDGDRYEMHDFVVMPNHAHLLVVFPDEERMLEQCESWKHFTAGKIHGYLGRKRRFWQQDAFDHLVRHEGQFERIRQYIAENPLRAGLREGEFLYYRK